MPRQVDSTLEGTYNGIIFYKQGDSYYKRKKGNTGNQAPEAARQAGLLGKASNLSARIRTILKPVLPQTKGREVMYRLNNVLQQWLRTDPLQNTEPVNEIAWLAGFCFFAYPDQYSAKGAVSIPRR